MPSCEAWVQTYRDLVVCLKEGGSASALRGCCRIALIKVDNIFQEQISVINLNHYKIIKPLLKMYSIGLNGSDGTQS
jgi:hypothetical protein